MNGIIMEGILRWLKRDLELNTFDLVFLLHLGSIYNFSRKSYVFVRYTIHWGFLVFSGPSPPD